MPKKCSLKKSTASGVMVALLSPGPDDVSATTLKL